MPELPEVEITRRILETCWRGRRIVSIEHHDPLRYRSTQHAEGRRILRSSRRGKFLLLHLEGGRTLVIHLGMTGGFRFGPDPHTRVILHLEDGSMLYFRDPRRFGRWWVTPPEEVGLLQRLGPEPLSPQFTFQAFRQRLQRNQRIKDLLLGQEVVAGLGNIYTDEALWRAKIHPASPARQLQDPELRQLYRAIRQVLREALSVGGSTLSDRAYQQPDGHPGYFQLHHRVYGRAGQPCVRCAHPIEKITLGGRGTHFCPHCQAGPAGSLPPEPPAGRPARSPESPHAL